MIAELNGEIMLNGFITETLNLVTKARSQGWNELN